MDCKFCGSIYTMKYGFKTGIQYYKCHNCNRKFAGRLAPEGMRFETATIGEAIGLFYGGLSLAGISRHLKTTDSIEVAPATVWRWVVRYSKKADQILNKIKIRASKRWVIDEMTMRIGGQKVWLWDVIESDSRFVLATNLGRTRTMRSAVAILSEANSRTIGLPKEIVSDGIRTCPGTVEKVFGADSTLIHAKGLTAGMNANILERFQGTAEERAKVMRGLKTIESARIISEGFIMHYNFLRPHMKLRGKTPAFVAGLELPFKTWNELVDYLWRISE